ncbi:MAG: 2-C-methyl-D-erythritol 4-phosphate cytidylyltransferase [Wolbachia endosymbiont of Tyrophagus putrescentiae]|nr:2-C-methyl-D-erythritol 4-phosphate cytidylyltransferase [Wolbachia endosymbiont of Tyrophagus putrescentiae]
MYLLWQTKMYKLKKYIALIVAAGVGSRCNTSIPKQYIKLAGKPVLLHVIEKFLSKQYIDHVRVVINENHENLYKQTISSITDSRLLSPVHGGENRQNSVKIGLESIKADHVIIHDACRPFVSSILIEKLIEHIDYKYTGVVPAIYVEDTISLIKDGLITSTTHREKLRAIQTPQIFNFEELLSCHQSTKELFTDDSSLVLAQGKNVAVIQGEKSNFKLTTVEDIRLLSKPIYGEKFLEEMQQSTAEYLDVFEKRKQASTTKLPLEIEFRKRSINVEPKLRIGSGYDIHRFVKQNNNKCLIKICGVEIEHNMAIDAHSDGDVAIHAIVDAILGALGCGDIGEHFPPNSPQWKDHDSSHFLEFAVKKAEESGYSVSNLDVTIICEEPKISPYKAEMRKSLAKILKINNEFINIKATTAEKLGSIGRSEGIAAHAVVLLS